MPLCPQITNTPVTVVQNSDFDVTSVVPVVADTTDGLAVNLGEVIESSGNQVYRQLTPPTSPPFTLKIGDQVSVKRRTVDNRNLQYNLVIEGMNHKITNDDWQVTFHTSPINPYSITI